MNKTTLKKRIEIYGDLSRTIEGFYRTLDKAVRYTAPADENDYTFGQRGIINLIDPGDDWTFDDDFSECEKTEYDCNDPDQMELAAEKLVNIGAELEKQRDQFSKELSREISLYIRKDWISDFPIASSCEEVITYQDVSHPVLEWGGFAGMIGYLRPRFREVKEVKAVRAGAYLAVMAEDLKKALDDLSASDVIRILGIDIGMDGLKELAPFWTDWLWVRKVDNSLIIKDKNDRSSFTIKSHAWDKALNSYRVRVNGSKRTLHDAEDLQAYFGKNTFTREIVLTA